MTTLVWYRNDLRLADHGPLSTAVLQEGPVRALYLICPRQWDQHHVAPLRRWYVLQSLRELGHGLMQLGIPLDIVDCDDFAGVPDVLEKYCQQKRIKTVLCNREYPVNERQRDRKVADRLERLGVAIKGFDDGLLVPPFVLKTRQGSPYTVFTPYKKTWLSWLADHSVYPAGMPDAVGKACTFDSEPVIDNALADLSVADSLISHWSAGEQAARQQLDTFVAQGLGQYQTQRDFPALQGTSGLSVALSAGTLAVSRCYQQAMEAMRAGKVNQTQAMTWISELCWRDFYRQIMANYPQVSRDQPFRKEGRFLPWSNDESHFQAWCEGRTGYPLVDAAMQQLLTTGWMHNRLRMVVAMFLTKQLFIDWRWGEQFFMQHLMDGDYAANNGGWQWSASTGTDAAPYFRVFNPVRQSERFDPEGVFIRRYLPQLASLQGKHTHQPWLASDPIVDYPQPVVSLTGVKGRVVAAFRQARDMAANLEQP